ncbi:SRPBCC family protein [Granulicella sp. S190]|uniref:SRPBCC family protein n=1 Tax=Granulicella sp. S190 TaxID=1747226 RepID=UPI001C20ABC8|nr:SRPBCC family protein [Granulicella sp. S190]
MTVDTKVEMKGSTAEREIVLTRVFDAPRAMVWEAWTDPKQVALWWGPKGFTTTIEVMDVRPGGVWKHVMHGPDGTDYPNESVFLEVVPRELLVYTLTGGRAGGPVVNIVKTATFEEVAGGTRVTMRHVFASAEARDENVRDYGSIEGGKQTLERLAGYLSERLAANKQGGVR